MTSTKRATMYPTNRPPWMSRWERSVSIASTGRGGTRECARRVRHKGRKPKNVF
jgi:hypothetical protein